MPRPYKRTVMLVMIHRSLVLRATKGLIPIGRIDDYRAQLRRISDWVPYLLAESNLPGPRGNLDPAWVEQACGRLG